MKIYWICLLFSCVSCAQAGEQVEIPAIIPEPKEISTSTGQYTIKSEITVAYESGQLAPAADFLAEILQKEAGIATMTELGNSGDIILSSNKANTSSGEVEGYNLVVQETGIRIGGNSYAGVINAIATLRQLIPVCGPNSEENTGINIPCCRIEDTPRYAWRGIMLDVARHFFTKEEVKELLDLMSLYKLNKFHWHLTDDQGWRVEIKKYPLLTERGAWRRFNDHDSTCMALMKESNTTNYGFPENRLKIEKGDTLYGGYYTQEDIREIVQYAADRGIDVLPEIDMPGHMLAAVDNYRWLACSNDLSWGPLFSCPICPGKDSVLNFCKDIYTEIFALFPYSQVHIGGDEVDHSNWEHCAECQQRMKKHGITSLPGLQAWFTHEMETFFAANGKEMIGWDEIINGGLSKTATVMWWRSWSSEPVIEVAGKGTKIVACPNTEFYLDYAQNKHSITQIYHADSLFSKKFDNPCFLGVQGNLWTEEVPSRERMQYMIFPRLLAVAETGWTHSEKKSLGRFEVALETHLSRLNAMNVAYRIPDIDGFFDKNVFLNRAVLNLNCADRNAVIYYTTDNSIPDTASAEYTIPIEVTESTDFTFRTFGKNGRQGEIFRTKYVKEELAEPCFCTSGTEGLDAVWYDYSGKDCAGIEAATPKKHYVVPEIMIPNGVSGNIGLILKGYIRIPVDGIYTFHLNSDDGSILYVNNEVIVDNDGTHSSREKVGQYALKAGYHSIEVRYFDHNGGILELKVTDPAGKKLNRENLFFRNCF